MLYKTGVGFFILRRRFRDSHAAYPSWLRILTRFRFGNVPFATATTGYSFSVRLPYKSTSTGLQ